MSASSNGPPKDILYDVIWEGKKMTTEHVIYEEAMYLLTVMSQHLKCREECKAVEEG